MHTEVNAPMDLHTLPDAHASVLRFLRRRLRSADDAEEIAQETMVRCVTRASRGTGYAAAPRIDRWKAFAMRVAKNLWLDRAQQRPDEELVAEPTEMSTHRPSRVARRGEREVMVRTAMQSLPPATREIVRLRHEDALSLREIAETLGDSYEAVRKRYTRALGALRENIGRVACDAP